MANIDPFFPTGAYSYVAENDVLTSPPHFCSLCFLSLD